MSLLQEEDITRLMQEPALMTEIARAVVDTPGVMEQLADDIAEELRTSSTRRRSLGS